MEEVFGKDFTGAVSISDFSSLDGLGRWLEELFAIFSYWFSLARNLEGERPNCRLNT